jgi:hypothetical protein
MVNSTRRRHHDSLSPAFLTAVLPMVSGIASYGWSAWVASETGSACDLSGAGAFGVTLIVVYFAPAIAVVYAAIATRKSRLATVGLGLAAAIFTFVAISVAALFWAGGNNCLG